MIKTSKLKEHQLEDGRKVYCISPLPFSACSAIQKLSSESESERNEGIAELMAILIRDENGEQLEELKGKSSQWLVNNISLDEFNNFGPIIQEAIESLNKEKI